MAAKKINKNQQKSTLLRDLSPEQNQVIASLVVGRSVTEAAQDAGVDRTTVYLWKRTDPAFVAELNRLHQEARRTIHASYRFLAVDAVQAVRDILSGEGGPSLRLKAALAVLDQTGAGKPEPAETTDVEPS